MLKTEIEREALKVTFKWPLKVFSEIASAIETGSRPTGGVGNITSGVLSLGGEHIDNSSGFLNLSEPKYVPIEFYERADRGKLQKGDLLICKDGAMTGKVAIVRDELEGQKAMINEHVFIIRCENEITQNYLFFFLYSPFGQDLLRSNITGSAQGGLNRSNLTKINVPYPPDSIQEKVVAECQKIDAEVKDAEVKIVELKEVINEIVADIKGETTKLGTVAQFKNGLNYKETPIGDTVSIVGVANFKDNKSPNWDEVKTITIRENVDDSYLLHKNDLVTVRSNGSRELVGRFMLIDKEPKERTTFSGFSIRVRIVSDKVDSEFLYYLLSSANIRQRLTTGSNGANIKSLNQDLLSNLEIPHPPLSEQKKVIDKIGAIESEIASLRIICDEASARKKAILQRELIEDDKQAVEPSSADNGTNEEESKIIILPNYREGCVPLYTLHAACGYFENGVIPEEEGWVDASGNGFTPDPKRHFAVHAKGNSMFPKIKDGDICVFEWYHAGKGDDEIVLAQCSDFGSNYDGKYTIKKYHSEEVVTEEGQQCIKIYLKPLNKDPQYHSFEFGTKESDRIIGIFKCVL